jgi:hypothetical protein
VLAPVTARGLPPYEDDAVHGPNAQIAVIPRPRNWRVKSTFNHLAIGFSVSISTDDI